MKIFLKAFIIFTGLLVSPCVFGDPIPTEGTWTDKGIRTLIPPPPSASIEGNTLSIYLPKPLTNLTVQVIDLDGNIVYKECISSYEDSFTYDIPLDLSSGEYQLGMVHRYGTLYGTFNMD